MTFGANVMNNERKKTRLDAFSPIFMQCTIVCMCVLDVPREFSNFPDASALWLEDIVSGIGLLSNGKYSYISNEM